MTRRKADEEENCGEAEGRPGSTTGPVCSVPSQRLRCHRTRQKNDAKKKREERKERRTYWMSSVPYRPESSGWNWVATTLPRSSAAMNLIYFQLIN